MRRFVDGDLSGLFEDESTVTFDQHAPIVVVAAADSRLREVPGLEEAHVLSMELPARPAVGAEAAPTADANAEQALATAGPPETVRVE